METSIIHLNGPRPSIDPLFRSAAASYDQKVIDVILSGSLGDGVSELNALGLKFHQDSVPPEVEVSGELLVENTSPPTTTYRMEEANWIALRVKDNGIGFDEKHLERILQPFERLNRPGEYDGTGMGLAICRKIVERHGGKITATSAEGAGSTFIVTLPVRQEAR